MRILKLIAIFWLGIVPLAILVLMFGPMFTKPAPASQEIERTCDADCMDKLLAS